MTDNKVVIVVGLTGVGKTTLIDRLEQQINRPLNRLSHGSLLLEEGKERDIVHDRDNITELSMDEYDDLQSFTAGRISRKVHEEQAQENSLYVLDTHATLHTPYGYRPGLTHSDVEKIDPCQFIFIQAEPQEIRTRREQDESRNRDKIPINQLAEQQDIALQMASSMSVETRAPLQIINNPDGQLDSAVQKLKPLFVHHR